MKERKIAYILLALSVIWAIIIFIACSIPSGKLPGVKIQHADKMAHFLVFFVQSVLLSLFLRFMTQKSYFQIILISTLQAFVYGGIIEVLQSEFFNRSGDVFDLLADTLGGFLGAAIYPIVPRALKLLRKNR
jgi:VanZ family protein